MIEPNNALELHSIDTPSPITSNVESLHEAESDKTPFELSLLSIPGIKLLHPSVPGPLEFRDELCVTFGGKFGRQVRWENIMPSVDHFIERCAWDTTHSLTVVLKPSSTPYEWTLKRLFNCFDKRLVTYTDGSRKFTLSVFNHISITFPDEAEDVHMVSDVAWPSKNDITSASNLREFIWKGPFQQLSNFLYPADGLTLLSITGCRISVDDAVELLQPCSSLRELQLETVEGTKAVGALTPKPGFKFILIKLSVTSSVDLAPMLKLIEWAQDEAELNITFLDNGTQDENALSSRTFFPQHAHVGLNLKGKFSEDTMKRLGVMR